MRTPLVGAVNARKDLDILAKNESGKRRHILFYFRFALFTTLADEQFLGQL